MFKFVSKKVSPLFKGKETGKKRHKTRPPKAKKRQAANPETAAELANEMVQTIKQLTDEKTGKRAGKKLGKKAKKETRRRNEPAGADAEGEITSERKKLIEHALSVQRAKAHIFNDLKDEEKKKLYALAVKTLLRQDDGKKGH